jgi:hypothetical protein
MCPPAPTRSLNGRGPWPTQSASAAVGDEEVDPLDSEVDDPDDDDELLELLEPLEHAAATSATTRTRMRR